MTPAFALTDIIFKQQFLLSAESMTEGLATYGGTQYVKFVLKRDEVQHQNLQGALGSFYVGYTMFVDEGTLPKALALANDACAGISCVQTGLPGERWGSLGRFVLKIYVPLPDPDEEKKRPKVATIFSQRQNGQEGMVPLQGGLDGDLEFVLVYAQTKEPVKLPKENVAIFQPLKCLLEVTLIQARKKIRRF